ncbi:phage tail sheath family protein [Kitasatospora acidiphila]|uniref:phage tail sheath family protein n=1 Tax=Kitasatospora acidiphila TaxID=2567942 RepID=UPI003C7448AF
MTGSGALPRTSSLSSYRTPGVRLEWLDAASQARTPLRTDIAGFIGVAQRGPLHRPVRVDGWDQFRGVFGDHLPTAYLAYAVEGFYANGGTTCWVVRVADPDQARAATAQLLDAAGKPALTLAAGSPGSWGEQVRYRVQEAGTGAFTLSLSYGPATEVWRNLGTPGRDPLTLLNDPATGSRLVTVSDWSGMPAAAGWLTPSGGADGVDSLLPEHFEGHDHAWGLATLDVIDEVAMVVAPDLWARPVPVLRQAPPPPPQCGDLCAGADTPAPPPPPPRPVPTARPQFTAQQIADLQQAIVAHCERHHNRVALLDSPQDPLTSPADALAWRARFDSDFGALYYPWLLVTDPLDGSDADVTAVPPSGHLAGVCARVDTTVGVHKPPAGEVIELPVDTVFAVDDLAHGDLNDGNVNAIRVQRGVRVLGDRTLTVSLPEWRFLNVRRLVSALEAQIAADTAWTVFEPNGTVLWAQITSLVRGFLDQVWRRGMLNGATADDAYTVVCDASVNPPSDVAVGKLTCLITLNPPPPAEFVVIRVVRTPTGVSVVDTRDESGGGHA